MIQIDSESYKCESYNYYSRSTTVKHQIVIANSLRPDHNHLVRMKNSELGKSKSWCTYTITRNGKIYEHYNGRHYSDFLGKKRGDRLSISIVLENMGCLVPTPDDLYVNWLNEVCANESVGEFDWKKYRYWEKYPDEQIDSLVKLCDKLCTEFNINRDVIDFTNYNSDIFKYKGIVFKSNYDSEDNNMNKLFNLKEFVLKFNNL